jgi:transitional endoplasmic reticulum ATPase
MENEQLLGDVSQVLRDAINLEVSGNKDLARDKYLYAYKILKKLALTEKGEKQLKREAQCSAILRAYKNAGGTDDLIKDASRETQGEGLLNSIGIETPVIPNITFEDVAGLENIKKEIMAKLVLPMKYKDLSLDYGIKFGGGMLLFGPPGTGKTYIVKAIANEVNAKFIYVNPATIYSEWFGKFEKNISTVFKAARMLKHAIIFFDEVDTLAPRRDTSEGEVVRRGVTQLLTELNGMESSTDSNIYVIAATNNPWEIDEALLRSGRFETKIYVPPPDLLARKRLFEISLRDVRSRSEIDSYDLASLTDGYTGADIEYICRRARQDVFMRAVESGSHPSITTEDIKAVISQIKPTVSRAMVKKYEEFSSTIFK